MKPAPIAKVGTGSQVFEYHHRVHSRDADSLTFRDPALPRRSRPHRRIGRYPYRQRRLVSGGRHQVDDR